MKNIINRAHAAQEPSSKTSTLIAAIGMSIVALFFWAEFAMIYWFGMADVIFFSMPERIARLINPF